MIRKRAPGGGRKPRGAVPMRSQVNVRMPDGLRAELDAAARKRGRNVSEELLARLRSSFAREREHQRDPALRAWGFLISEVASYSHFQTPNWHKNPWWFRAFKLAVIELLNALEPRGELRPPKDSEGAEETPEAQAKIAANIVLHLLRGDQKSREEQRAIAQTAGLETSDWALDDLELDRNRYARVREDLQLRPTKKRGD
jgi:hypothetical protein